jgi:hypothetical protein
MWVKRFLTPDEASWKALLTLNLQHLLGKDTFKCSLECKNTPTNFPNFYWLMIKAWNKLITLTSPLKTAIDIRRECLWLNKNIMVNKKQIKWNAWHNKGINIIHDILNTKGEFLLPNKLEEKFNIKCNIMTYNTLKDAIPYEWRKLLKTMKIPLNTMNFDEQIHININKKTKIINKVSNKDIYWILVKNIQVKPIIIEKYKHELGIEETRWKTIFTIPRVLKDTKIRAFQYKLLFKLTPCNYYLKKMGKNDTDICNWCKEVDDTVHYFAECQKLTIFWSNFAKWFANATDTILTLTLEDIIVGVTKHDKDSDCLNACILLAKWHIYKNKLNQSETFFYRFLCEIKYYIIVEKTIAAKNNRLAQFKEMWQKIENYIT